MRLSVVRPLALTVIAWVAGGGLFSQTVIKPLSLTARAEPGLEMAVNWKWWVEPTGDKEWGMPLPDALRPKTPGDAALDQGLHPAMRPETYEVKKGDALIKIAKKFEMTVAQLKQFNELKDDRIFIGQVLRIPTPGDLLTMIPPPPPPVTIDDLVAEDFLGYTSAWEFVAERFHCDEEFLHHINPQLKGMPVVGSEFQVPNVIPFEIENALDPPLQPAADPQKPVTAAVVVLTRLDISCDGKLIAVMPLSVARPGLHGRDKWTVLAAIPQPCLATKREARVPPKEKPATPAAGVPNAEPVVQPALEKAQHLACGSNNPVGIIWIDLAKGTGTDPLPYGLHGTSIPSKMGSLQGIGGLRLTNWDIARAVRLMPAGTTLQWKAQ